MHCSVTIWPNSQNPASFVPIITDLYPFDTEKPIKIFDSGIPEVCPSCKHTIDLFFLPDGDKLRCPWCSKSIKPTDPQIAEEQRNRKRFIFRSPAPSQYKQLLILAIDTTCTTKELGFIKSHVLAAISALPEDQQFLICIMNSTNNTYVDVINDTVVCFDIPFNTSLTKHLNLNRALMTPKNMPLLKTFISSLTNHQDRTVGIDNLVKQLKEDDNLFTRIILFSPKGPSRKQEKNICLHWISPSLPTKNNSHNIDGYFLDTSLYSFDATPAIEQINNLIHKATVSDQVFNVKIHADVSHYNCSKRDFFYSSCLSHFSQTFKLTSEKIFGSILPSVFGVSVEYVHFIDGVPYNEVEWCAQQYTKSDSFIPVATSIDPYQLMPYLITNHQLDSFVNKLKKAYHTSIDDFPGTTPDSTFSTFPNLQLFLRVRYGERDETFFNFKHNRVFISYNSRSATFYPLVTLWADQNTCIGRKCSLGRFFYMQMQSPPFVVYDEVQVISIYSDSEIDNTSLLYKEIENEVNDRFPKPLIINYKMKEIECLFTDHQNLIERIQENE